MVWRDDPFVPNDRTRDRVIANAVITIHNLTPITTNTNNKYTYPTVPITLNDKKVNTIFNPSSDRQKSFSLPTLQNNITNKLRLLLQTTVPQKTETIHIRLVNTTNTTISNY